MGKKADKLTPRSNSGTAGTGFTITGRNMDGRKASSAPTNRGKGAKTKK